MITWLTISDEAILDMADQGVVSVTKMVSEYELDVTNSS